MVIKANETMSVAVLTANSANINYPVSNILHSSRTKVFKTVALTTTATIVFDCLAAVTCNSIDIDNHNISSGATIKWQGNATDAWGAPSVDEELTWSADIINKDFTGGSYRYWRLHIVDAGNTDTFIKLGRVFGASSYTTPGLAQIFGDSIIDNSVYTEAAGGTTYGDIRYFKEDISVKWNKILTAERATMKAQFLLMTAPHFITFDESVIPVGTLYVTKAIEGLHFNLLRNSAYWETAMQYKQEK